MKYKILIVTANYYADISSNLLKKAKTVLRNKSTIKVINFIKKVRIDLLKTME